MCCYITCDRLKHSVSGHGYNGYKSGQTNVVAKQGFQQAEVLGPIHTPQCSWKVLREENVTPPNPYKIHGNSKIRHRNSKIWLCSRFKRKFQSDCMFPSSAGDRGWKYEDKSSSSSKMRVPLHSVKGIVN